MIKIRKRFDDHKTERFVQNTSGESMTQQQFKEECDVNNILAKYRKTNMITHINKHSGQFGDFATAEDYQETLHRVMQAQESFNHIPSDVRAKFNNDPARLIEFLADPKNQDEAVKLGLRQKPTPKPETLQESMEKALENNDKKRTAKTTKKD